ncbi:MAG: hypothetical protein U9R38_00300 [Candidatus Margulisiibacteriota bacterium]|nr:hypothetical protein [Candidatus Margulisiibacteriota bacterium]
MKRIIAALALFVFVIAVAGTVYADTRSPAEKLAAGRAYLKLLDKKIIRLRKAGKAKVVKNLQAQKKSTIARMKVWKAQSAAAVAPPPPPAPVAPTPPPPRRVARPVAAPSAGLFGMGLQTDVTLGYLAGESIIVARGDLILADALGIGPMLGLSDDAVTWRVGLGGAVGKDTVGNDDKKAIPLFVDGVIAIPADIMGGIDSYVGGGLNYVVYGSEKTSGSYGGQIYYGIAGDVGLGGTSYAELAYSIIRSGPDATVTPYSMKGIGINFGTEILL